MAVDEVIQTLELEEETEPSSNGRQASLSTFDEILTDPEVQRQLRLALLEELTVNPVSFFKQFIMPLLPKTQSVTADIAKSLSPADFMKIMVQTTIGDSPTGGSE
jgi:hypothetical protein